MSTQLRITSGGVVDRTGFAGRAGPAWISRSWSELGLDPLTDKIRWPFPALFSDFRHLDRLGRILCIAAECAGLVPRAPPDADDTALVSISAHGCLDSDFHFERSLGSSRGTQAGLFPFTLASTGLGALAIRYGLRGPTLAFSAPPGGEGRAIRDATELVTQREAGALVLSLGDWIGAAAARGLGIESRAEIVALRIEPGDPDGSSASERWPSIDALFQARDPVSLLIDHVRSRLRS